MLFSQMMKRCNKIFGIFATSIMIGMVVDQAWGQLPMAPDAEKPGYFAFLADRNLESGVSTEGEIMIHLLDRKRSPMTISPLAITPLIVENRLGQEDITRKLIAESLETNDSPTTKFSKTTYRGKAINDALMEVTVEQNRDVFLLGGRIIEPGKSRNPQAISYGIRLYDVYKGPKLKIVKALNEKEKEKAAKDFEMRTRDDRITLKLVDGKRIKYSMLEPIGPLHEQIRETRIEQVELEYAAYPNRKIILTASPNSEFTIQGRDDSSLQIPIKGRDVIPLNLVLSIRWKSHPEKDPNYEAKLAVQVK